ncbi:hypothetical protein [Paenibacillus sp. SI8]|uniref:hypothetical protein n=1 Tax=unclassified Paenibacillus TaxID=185978 RepID=UPI003465EA3C
MKYVKPSMLDYGRSENVIKGECDWGSEGFTFDRTGSYETQRRDMVYIGHWGGMDHYQCQYTTKCSTFGDAC